MIDMSVNIEVSCFDLLSKGMHRLATRVQVFGIECGRIGIINNLRRYKQKPMYRKRALLKNLKNRR